MFKLQLGLNKCSNQNYHKDKTWLSSSSLKTILKNPAQFHAELTEKKSEVENPSFTEGSLLHSLILEEDQIEQDYAFFTGLRKAGREFEEFKAANPGRVIISTPQKSRCLAYKRAFMSLPTAVNLLKGCEKEYTICAMLMDVPIKVRFDAINLDQSYGLDLKTSSFGVEIDSFKMTMQSFGYGLSAALYAWVAELHFGRPFDFYLIPIAKQELECHVYKLSEATIMRGRSDIIKALQIYKQCKETGIWPNSVELKVSKEVGDYQIQEV